MATEITTDRIRALAEVRSPEGKVLSVLVNLDPSLYPTRAARATEVRSALDTAAQTVKERADLTPNERSCLEADIERVRNHLESHLPEGRRSGSRGVAIFASEPADLFEIFYLPRPVEREVRISSRPAVRTLARLASTAPWFVVLVDRRHARLLSGDLGGIAEHWRTEDPVSGRHNGHPSGARDQSGTSHERFQRSQEKDVADHLRSVVTELRAQLEDEEFAGILLGGPADIRHQFRDLLPTDLARRVGGEFDVAVWTSGPDQILAAAAAEIERLERQFDDRLLERIGDGIGADKVATGVAAVLEAVNAHAVAKLAVVAGTSARGVRCPACGWLGLTLGGPCPIDGVMTEPVTDIVEEAVAVAIAHDADVQVFPSARGLLADNDGIVALRRF